MLPLDEVVVDEPIGGAKIVDTDIAREFKRGRSGVLCRERDISFRLQKARMDGELCVAAQIRLKRRQRETVEFERSSSIQRREFNVSVCIQSTLLADADLSGNA